MIDTMNKADKTAISKLCELFDVPVSSRYYKPVINTINEDIMEIMQKIHQENREAYGQRRMVAGLEEQGINIGRTKVANLMDKANIVAKHPKKPHDYQGGKEKPSIPNVLKRQFVQPQADTHWVGDITYIRNHQGWSYLATVLDLGTREIVGYALSQTPDAALAKQALLNAIKLKQPSTKGLLFHSDQGVQYHARLCKQTLALHGMTQSMSRRGNCWDNAVQERFFRSLKSEYLNGLSFINHQSVVTTVDYYIRYYNNKRINSAIGYITPAQKRQDLPKVA
ncbi:Mobile element protein [Bathymodiolus heckerae thiotrophic gill symbiont]|nr:Mobile element protein [Bathymodiolus heckerae thiotrophic gill symbiont]